MNLPTTVDYPIIAIGDLHGRVEWLNKLVTRLEQLPEWPSARLVFLGDLVDRTETVKQLVSRVMELIAAKPGSTCVTGNHDHALVNAAALHDRPASAYWVKRYGGAYDHKWTFRSYLDGHSPDYLPAVKWEQELDRLKAAMPSEHREFLASLPWMAEAEGHIFLHNGLSQELDCPASVQLECLRRKVWDRAVVNPRFGTNTDRLFTPDYPVWLGADRTLSANPLRFPGKVQVSGHEKIAAPDANAVRIRIDTSGGVVEPLTGACSAARTSRRCSCSVTGESPFWGWWARGLHTHSSSSPDREAPMRSIRTLALAALVYGGCIAATAVTPARADAQFVTSYYSTPFGYGYNYNYGVYPAGYYNYANYSYPYSSYYNWGGNTTPSGYPQWYVNYMRWNRPYNAYSYPAYNPYRWRRW